MTRTPRSASTSLTASISLALAYALLISLCAPVTSGTTTRRATAAAAASLSRRIAKRSRFTKATAQTITKKKGGHRDGELLARFRSTAAPQDINSLLAARAVARTGQLRGASGIERLTVPVGQDPETIAAELRTYPIIDFVEPNYLISKDDTTPNDPQFSEQWALRNTGAAAGHAGADINVMGAWETTTGSASTVIAVIDSGIDFSHPDLAANEWTNAAETKNKQDEDGDGFIDDTHGWDFVADTSIIKDEAGHGTAVAGIIASEGNNGTGIAGVMWHAQLMSLRVLDKAGTGDVARAVEAIDYASAHGAQVINLSWGTDEASLALKDAIRRASRRNTVVVCSAGNDARDVESAPYYPASFDLTNLISVASTDNQDNLAAWSNSGQTHVTIAAPGVDVLTTKTGKGYQTLSGTSASAPLVAGVAGLIKTLRPQLSAVQTKAMIVGGARSVAALAGKVSAGGVVSAAGAVQAMSALPPNEGVGSSDSEASNNNSNDGGNTGSNATGGSSSNAGDNNHGVGNYTGRPHAVPQPQRGAPGLNLPNLDVERRRPHHEPHVPASTHPDLQKGAPTGHSSALPSGEAYPVLAYTTGDQYHSDLTAVMKNAAAMKSNEHALFDSLITNVSFDELLRNAVSDSTLPLLRPRIEEAAKNAADSSGNDGGASLLAGATGKAATISAAFAMQSNSVTFTDDPLVAGTTVIKAVHLTELRSYVNQARARANLSAAMWTDANLTAGYLIRAVHIMELRGRLDEARAALGMTAASYTDPSLSSGSSVRAIHIQELRDRVREALGVSSAQACPAGQTQAVADFIGNFYTRALGRQPSTSELQQWTLTLQQAYARGQSQMLYAGRHLGEVLFLSAEYVARNRSDQDYVTDLYWAYLQRAPDQSGLAGWVNTLATHDRTYVRNGFAYATEFAQKVAQVCASSPPSGNNTNSSLQAALLNPLNRTGGGGEDPLSRNFNWSVPLLNLSGRAGLDLGLALSYNSLVWTRVGSSIIYDADGGTPAPGFHLGFPTIGGRYYNAETSKNAYLVTMPSGAHVELRQAGSSTTYEAADSSYLQLVESSTSLQLRTTDGTQLQYAAIGGSFQCTGIKDRNGNFITIGYSTLGYLSTITDTLGRVVTFNYAEGGSLLESITQAWNASGQAVHTWATFSYDWSTIQTNFNDGSTALSVNGPANGSSILALTQVNLDDGSSYKFDYNTYGQVRRIARLTPHSDTGVLTDERSVTSYNLPLDSSVPQSDCPRFTERHDTAQDWTGQNGVPADVVTTYSVPAAGSWTMQDGTSESGTKCQVTLPDGTFHRLFYHATGWDRGLLLREETWAGSVDQRWTETKWTQDNTGVSYPVNPRPTETNVYDKDNNRRRSTVSYTSYGLPEDTVEYDANGTTPLRSTHTIYNLDTVYLNRRIIGLPSEQTMSGRDPLDGTTKLYSKVGYVYDEGGDFLISVSPVQHDEANYSSGFITGRGLVTSVRRYDAKTPTSYVESKMGYDAAGNVLFTRRPGDDAAHQTSIEYTDSFSDGVNHNTFAYPTRVTDADGYSSTLKYRYDIGAVTLTLDPKGAETTVDYDTVGRKQKVSRSGAQTRIEYPASLMLVSTFTLIEAGVENYSAQVLDGAGRVRATGGDYVSHDAASTAVYRAQVVRYDAMGRAFAQSNPTEINATWQPAGNDAAGWLFTNQTYDWKGRPLISTNTDGTTTEASYGGCGCAGGEVTTILDEVGRKQKSYTDVMGRVVKQQVLKKDDSNPTVYNVYATTTTTYNARDQVMKVIEAAGESTTGQTTTITYDGHGRVASKQSPIESAASTYSYNPNDTTQTATDARGVVATFSYNHRRLVTRITYAVPANANPAITATSSVNFDYDAAGNRQWMTDGSGRVDYTFDTWSRLRSETRQFAGLSGSFALSYDYNLAGQLKSITDPFSATNYTYDKAGQLTDVSGTAYGASQQYATGMQYRAWGSVKHISYGNGLAVDMTYNNRLQTQQFDLKTTAGARVLGFEYNYNDDGRIRYSHSLPIYDPQIRQPGYSEALDRAYSYDHVGRLTTATTGTEARGGTTFDGPFKQTYDYDEWDNLKYRYSKQWIHLFQPTGGCYGCYYSGGYPQASVDSATYVNNRREGWQYDAAGNLIGEPQGYTYDVGSGSPMTTGPRTFTYDAAGQSISTSDPSPSAYIHTLAQVFDGDDGSTKQLKDGAATYYLRASVMNEAVAVEMDASGQKLRGYVYANGQLVALQENGHIEWQHRDPTNVSARSTNASGAVVSQPEFDPLGVKANDNWYNWSRTPVSQSQGSGTGDPCRTGQCYSTETYNGSFAGNPHNLSLGCTLDTFSAPCSVVMGTVNAGGANSVIYTPGMSGGSGGNGGTWTRVDKWEDSSDVDANGVVQVRSRNVGMFTLIPNGSGFGSSLGMQLNYAATRQFLQSPPKPEPTQGRLSEEDCNKKLAAIFGGAGAVASTVNEPSGIDPLFAGDNRIHHLANNGVLHIYGNAQGTATDAALYRPPSGTFQRRGSGEYEEKDEYGGTGNYSNVFQFSYSGDLVIKFFHVGGTSGGQAGGAKLGNYPGQTNAKGSVRIGNVGGIGGHASSRYIHSHIEFRVNGRRTDPRKIYCGY